LWQSYCGKATVLVFIFIGGVASVYLY